jgi:formylglycine-generating enzyme required for sulfatase activity
MTRFVLLALLAAVAHGLTGDLSAQGCERNAPLGEDDVFKLVDAGVPEPIVHDAIVACRTTFILDDAGSRRLRALGASARLVNLIAAPVLAPPGTSWTAPIDRREMTWIPAGEFQMGSPADERGRGDDELQHPVRIERGFWLDISEVSNAAYRRFIVANPEWQKNGIDPRLHDGNYLQDWRGAEFPAGRGDYPVAWVSWHAAAAYAKWAGKRLPTEAEWEYAARAGSKTAYSWGASFDASRVAPLAPTGDLSRWRSGWGTIGLLGGVWEWTSTLYGAYPYQRTDGREDSARPGRRGKRGGLWNSGERFLRAANRSSESPELTSDALGFRCAR